MIMVNSEYAWVYSIDIKKYLNNEHPSPPSHTSNVCGMVIFNLKRIQNKLESKYCRIDEEEALHLWCEIEDILSNFEFLKELVDGEIPKKYWGEYDYQGDHVGLLNEYLDLLYDLGDSFVLMKKNNTKMKFLWVG